MLRIKVTRESDEEAVAIGEVVIGKFAGTEKRGGYAARVFEPPSRYSNGTDACFTPVLDLAEAPEHPHNRARGTFVHRDGMAQPAPAPRFSRTPADLREDADLPETARLLADWGLNRDDIAVLTHYR